MLLSSLDVRAHPEGNRVDIYWQFSGEGAEGIRVLRRGDRFPEHPEDGQIIYDGDTRVTRATDSALNEEKTFYYSLFPYRGVPAIFELDSDNRLSIVTSANNRFAEYMYNLLPAVYHRYDKEEKFLARFLQLIGGQVDQFYSYTRAMREFKNVARAPGPLLPLLADWIAWRLDTSKTLGRQKEEINDAPEIYKRIGLIPTVESTVKRITNWESRVKEYVHNIFTSNSPPVLNFWSRRRNSDGSWEENDEGRAQEKLFSLDWAYDGRASYLRDSFGIEWIFYHTYRRGRWELWFKQRPSLALPISLLRYLDEGPISKELLLSLRNLRIIVSASESNVARVEENIWRILDGSNNRSYIIEKWVNGLSVYDSNSDDNFAFSGSQAIVAEVKNQKYPTAGYSLENFSGDVAQLQVLWLFWSSYDAENARWTIQFRRRQNARWLSIDDLQGSYSPFISSPFGGDSERRYPVLCNLSAQENLLWLFWFERSGPGTNWSLCYTQRVHGPLESDPSTWSAVASFTLDDRDPRDLSVTLLPNDIFITWSGISRISNPEPLAGGTVGRRVVRYRFKGDTLMNANWSGGLENFPSDSSDENHHDAEPFALYNAEEAQIELFFASNRAHSSWRIYQSFLDEDDFASLSWSSPIALTEPASMQRAPLILPGNTEQRLLYRSARAVPYISDSYRATATFDYRYEGSLALDSREAEKIQLREQFEDAINYTYDTGEKGQRANNDKISRDTVGLFLSTDVASDKAVNDSIQILDDVLKDFSSISDRFVYIAQSERHSEYVYDYIRSGVDKPVTISSTYSQS